MLPAVTTGQSPFVTLGSTITGGAVSRSEPTFGSATTSSSKLHYPEIVSIGDYSM